MIVATLTHKQSLSYLHGGKKWFEPLKKASLKAFMNVPKTFIPVWKTLKTKANKRKQFFKSLDHFLFNEYKDFCFSNVKSMLQTCGNFISFLIFVLTIKSFQFFLFKCS